MEKSEEILKKILEKDAKKVASALDFRVLAGKSVMITGAGGFLGINFLTSLIEVSKKVSGITIYAIIHSSPSSFLLPFLKTKNVTVFQGDLNNERFMRSLPKADIILHAAGSGMPEQFLKNKLASLEINTVATFRLFEKLKKNGKFLFISSSDVYNGLKKGSYTENQIGTTNTNHPRACYIEGKKTGETICSIYRENGVDAHSVRLLLTYGPGMTLSDSRVLPSFIRKALTGKIDLLDSGKAFRSFCYVSDAIELIWFALLHGKQQTYNIGSTERSTISGLADEIGKIMRVPIQYPSRNASIGGAPEYVNIDINRIMDESKKKKFVPLRKGLRNTVNWFKQLKKQEIVLPPHARVSQCIVIKS